MLSIKGYASNINRTDNRKDVVNTVGELSADSITYTKDRGMYYQDANNGLVLTIFSAKQDGNQVTLNSTIRQHIFEVIDWVYKRSTVRGGQIYLTELLQDIITQFGSVAESFKGGKIVTDGTIWMPEWLSWKKTGEDTTIRIWFSDQAFRSGYDEFEITVVPPVTPVDDFYKALSIVRNHIDEYTPTNRTDKIQLAKAGKPETILRTELFPYNDRYDKTVKINTYWDYLIYGAAGNNIDSIKDTTINYILANSTHSREEWAMIFPDIFRRTEFTFVPNWDNYAIPNRVTEKGIYSPIVTVNQVVSKLTPFTTIYQAAHVKEHAQVMSHPYKSLILYVSSSNENRDKLFKITDVFPDYISEHSLSQDFNRQSEDTRLWAEKFSDLILAAEELTPDSDLPQGVTRLTRNGKLFAVMNFKNIHYLVAAKYNFEPTK